MSGDLAELISEVSPYVTTAVAAYGAAVLSRSEDVAADVTIGVGRRVLQRIFGTRADDEEAPEVLVDLAEAPADEDRQAGLWALIRRVLEADDQLAAEVQQLLAEAKGDAGPAVSATDHSHVVTGSRIGGSNIQIGEAGGDVVIRLG